MQNTEQPSMLGLFRQLRAISEKLRTALVARDVEEILRVVQEQEQIVSTCHHLRANKSATHQTPPDDASEMRALMADIQRLQHANQRVASAFLEAVDRTLTTLGVGAPRRRLTYGVDGWSRAPSTPVLFQQRG